MLSLYYFPWNNGIKNVQTIKSKTWKLGLYKFYGKSVNRDKIIKKESQDFALLSVFITHNFSYIYTDPLNE